MAHDREQPTKVIARRADVPAALSAIVDKALAKSPADRFGSAAEFSEALRPYAEGSDLSSIVTEHLPAFPSEATTSDISKYTAFTDTSASEELPRLTIGSDGVRHGTRLIIVGALVLAVLFAFQFAFRITIGNGTVAVEFEGKQIDDNVEPIRIDRPTVNATARPDRIAAEWAIRKNAIVTVHNGRGTWIVTRSKDLPTEDFSIGKIDFAHGCHFTGDELKRLTALTRLHVVAFQDPQLTELFVDHLARVPNLTNIELRFDSIAPNGIQYLQQSRTVRLDLYGSRVTDLDVAAASKLANVTWLELRSQRITDASLEHVGTMKQLKYLHLLQTSGISNEGIAHICHLPNLSELFAVDTAITDEGLAQLAGLKRLDWLNLDRTQVSDKGMSQIAKITWLKRLTLARTPISNAGLAKLRPLQQLFHLDLAQTQITDDAVDDLAAFPKMVDLRVGDRLSAAAIEQLRTRMPNCKVGPQSQ